jgi:hypothetical protein
MGFSHLFLEESITSKCSLHGSLGIRAMLAWGAQLVHDRCCKYAQSHITCTFLSRVDSTVQDSRSCTSVTSQCISPSYIGYEIARDSSFAYIKNIFFCTHEHVTKIFPYCTTKCLTEGFVVYFLLLILFE